LAENENLVEVWVVEASIDPKCGCVDRSATTFVMVDFYDYESQPTVLLKGLEPKYDFATTYKVCMHYKSKGARARFLSSFASFIPSFR
jgi:hypothetical protein